MSTIEQLEARIKQLEDKINKSNQMFGRSYSTNGSSNSDYLIKTKGQVKIQIGNKFIDLIKDGKINIDNKFIYQVDSINDIGSKNGIYVTSDELVYLKTNNNIINLVGEAGISFVSFMAEQDTTSEQKQIALKNIGFIYENQEEVPDTVVNNGIIYITSEQKLYIVRNGILSEYNTSFPNPLTEQFVIAKNNTDEGALVIRGDGNTNSIKFNTFTIYNDENLAILNSENGIRIIVDSSIIAELLRNGTTVYNTLNCNSIQSIGAADSNGFKLYMLEGKAVLEVDQLIVRDEEDVYDVTFHVYPTYWSQEHNIIIGFVEKTPSSTDGQAVYTVNGFSLTLKYASNYKAGDYIYTFGLISNDGLNNLVQIPLYVNSSSTVENDDGTTNSVIDCSILENDTLGQIEINTVDLIGQTTFLIGNGELANSVRISHDRLDLIQCSDIESEQQLSSVKGTIGDLTNLNLSMKENDTNIAIEDVGIYCNQGIFNNAYYTSDYQLAITDYSSRFASTEWLHKILPKGTIVMFGSTNIPDGWAICDGNNNTPNLSGYFIKAGLTSGDINTYNVISGESATEEQTTIQFQSYSLIFIMKII